MYVVEVLKRAKGTLDAMDSGMRDRVIRRLGDLEADPYREMQMVSRKTRRARVGKYRILYHICVPDRKVVVPCITKRGRAYDR